MYIKSINIYGFKSFAEKVHMDLNPGITAIVGPNGCGKSNVADAVRWVLGEQSPKTLRGGKMQDVIFAGTQLRKPLSIAEVTLCIDNSNESLPIESPEVIISRRVLRSGDNEYYLNKSLSRLKDITDVLLDTGLGREGYSIIDQGRINEILSINPAERRQVFEQAAGIGKYKMRKLEAENKLQKTRENTIRIEDILSEIEQQLVRLKYHSDRAIEYNLAKKDLKSAEINKFLNTYKKSSDRLEQLNAQLSLYSKDAIKHSNESSYIEFTLKESKQRLIFLLNEYETLKDDELKKVTLYERLKAEFTVASERLERISEDSKLFVRENLRDDQIIAERQLSISKSEELILYNNSQINEKRILLGELDKRHNHLTNLSSIDSDSIEKNKLRIAELTNEITDLKFSLAKQETILEGFENEILELNKLYLSVAETLETVTELLLAKNINEEEKTSKLDVLKLERAALGSEVELYSTKIQKLELDTNNNLTKFEAVKSRLDLLETMHANFEGYNFGVKNILRAKKQGNLLRLNVYGTVADLMTVDKRFRPAIEASLGNSLQHIVTENEEEAKEIIEFLRKNEYGRATFLPVSSVRSRLLSKLEMDSLSLNGSLGIASDIVGFDEKFRGIFENLLGRTIITENIDQAIFMARKFGYAFRIVTLKADLINPGGSITGGDNKSKSSSIIGREQEINELKAELSQLNTHIASLKNSLAAIYKESDAVKYRLKSCTGKSRDVELEHALVKQELLSLTSEIEKKKAELRNLEFKKQKLDGSSNEVRTKLQLIAQQQDALSNRKNEILEKSTKSESDIEQVSSQKLQLEKQLAAKKEEILLHKHDISSLNEKVEFLSAEIVKLMESKNARNRKISENEITKADLEKQLLSLKNENEKLATEVDALSIASRTKEEEKLNLSKQIETLEERLDAKRHVLQQMQELQHKTELKIAKIEAEIDHSDRYIWNEYELTYGKALSYLDKDLDQNQIEHKISSSRKKIENLGEVNLTSIEEYKTVKQRYDSLCYQKLDLIEAKGNLDKVIEEITTAMKKEFCSEFEILSNNFSSVFSKLFGGGKAQLILEDESQPLDCGIEIAAQPPGKKLQSISLLSGGEKALTAASILFAILKRKPAVFCVLDEIDAALDESNLYNLGNFLREFSGSTQFILITHRKATMEICDSLYGVVMEEKGISKLVSVKLEGIAV